DAVRRGPERRAGEQQGLAAADELAVGVVPLRGTRAAQQEPAVSERQRRQSAGVARPLRARRMVGPFHGLGREREQHGEGKGGGSMHAVFLLVVVGRWRFDATRGPTVATSSATVNPRSCYHPITKRTRDVAAPLAWRDQRAAAYTRGG